ncbi:MAG TPA: MEKHLA domain-containing protein [Sulfuricaulis sp.]
MSTFFAVGIVLNVVLTGLVLYWLWRQRMPKTDRNDSRKIENISGKNMHVPLPVPDKRNDFLSDHACLLISSYRYWTGSDLIDSTQPAVEQARALYEAPFVVASHGTGDDPVFNYANRSALALFETGWAEFTSMPSRLSAEPVEREERARLLNRVNWEGFIDDYNGVRITSTGRRFHIRHATVWNVIDANKTRCGQAVMFREWEYL